MLTFVLAQVFHFPQPTYKSPSLLLSTIVPYILPSNTLGCNKSIHQSFKLLVPTPFFSAGLLNRYMPDRAALLCCLSLVPIQEMERKLSMLTSSPNTEGQGASNFFRRHHHQIDFLWTRPAEFFWDIKCQSPRQNLGQKVIAQQFSASYKYFLPGPESSEVGHFKAI